MRVLIVDDEPPARRRLRRLLRETPDIEIVGEAGDGEEAVEAIGCQDPDLVFLDVQMPGLDGFGVLEALSPPTPAVIFVTAFDEYALQAFDVHAVDYLLKPFEDERFAEALSRVRALFEQRRLGQHRDALAALVAERRKERAGGRLAIKRGETIHLLETAQVERIDAEGNRSRLFLRDGRETTLRRSLKQMEAELPAHFVRVHRSHIVNARRIVRLHTLFHGEFAVELESGAQVRATRTYVAALRRELGLDDSAD